MTLSNCVSGFIVMFLSAYGNTDVFTSKQNLFFNWHSGAHEIVYIPLTALTCLYYNSSSIYFNAEEIFLICKSWAWSDLLLLCFLYPPRYKGNTSQCLSPPFSLCKSTVKIKLLP